MVSVNDSVVKLIYHAKEMTILRTGTVGTRPISLYQDNSNVTFQISRSPLRNTQLQRDNAISASDEDLPIKILKKSTAASCIHQHMRLAFKDIGCRS
jgi:hypothetical protein